MGRGSERAVQRDAGVALTATKADAAQVANGRTGRLQANIGRRRRTRRAWRRRWERRVRWRRRCAARATVPAGIEVAPARIWEVRRLRAKARLDRQLVAAAERRRRPEHVVGDDQLPHVPPCKRLVERAGVPEHAIRALDATDVPHLQPVRSDAAAARASRIAAESAFQRVVRGQFESSASRLIE